MFYTNLNAIFILKKDVIKYKARYKMAFSMNDIKLKAPSKKTDIKACYHYI